MFQDDILATSFKVLAMVAMTAVFCYALLSNLYQF